LKGKSALRWMLKALYGMLIASLLWYQLFRRILKPRELSSTPIRVLQTNASTVRTHNQVPCGWPDVQYVDRKSTINSNGWIKVR
jgi:hypothetical protein